MNVIEEKKKSTREARPPRRRLVRRYVYVSRLRFPMTRINSTAKTRICLEQSLQTVDVSNIRVSQCMSSFTAIALVAGCSLTTWLQSLTPVGLFLSLQAGQGDSTPNIVGMIVR